MQKIKLGLRVLALAVLVVQGKLVAQDWLRNAGRTAQANASQFKDFAKDYIAPATAYGNSVLNKIHALPTTEKVGGALLIAGVTVWLTKDKIAQKWNATAAQREKLGKVLAHCKDFVTGNLYAPHQAWLQGDGPHWKAECDRVEERRQRDLKDAGQWKLERDAFEGQLNNANATIIQLKGERDQWKSDCEVMTKRRADLSITTHEVADDSNEWQKLAEKRLIELDEAHAKLKRANELEKEKKKLEELLNPLRAPSEEWHDVVPRIRSSILGKQDQIADLTLQVGREQNTVTTLKQELASVKAQLQAATLALIVAGVSNPALQSSASSSFPSLPDLSSTALLMGAPMQIQPSLTPTSAGEQDSFESSMFELEGLNTYPIGHNPWANPTPQLETLQSQTLNVEAPKTVATVVTSQSLSSSSSSSTQSTSGEKPSDKKGNGQQAQTNSNNKKKKNKK